MGIPTHHQPTAKVFLWVTLLRLGADVLVFPSISLGLPKHQPPNTHSGERSGYRGAGRSPVLICEVSPPLQTFPHCHCTGLHTVSQVNLKREGIFAHLLSGKCHMRWEFNRLSGATETTGTRFSLCLRVQTPSSNLICFRVS